MLGRKGQLVSDSQLLKDAGREPCVVICAVISVTTALKDKGNKAYTQEDYETAVKYYSDGLNELRDMQPLYTNRAQVNIFNQCGNK